MPTTEKPVYRRPADVLEHLEGCPARPERIETIKLTRPRKVEAGFAADPVTTTRCIDCGAQVVKAG